MNKMNILWLFCEDVSPWMGCYGDNTVKTPVLDTLAKEGALFLNCYSTAPVCSPARSGIITGCMPTTMGLHQHVSSRLEEPPIHLPDYVETLPEIFRKKGYFTYNNGKDDYNFVYNREELYAGPYHHIQFYGPHGTGHWREREPGQSFFGQITLWGGKNKNKPKVQVDPDKVKVAPYYPQTEEFKQQYIQHYNQIIVTDEEVGAILQQLKDDCLYENTIIIFMGDHGYGLLRHKQFLYDGGIHVPLIIAAPGHPELVKPGIVRDDLVSSLDITATTLALAGFDKPEWMESVNVFDPEYRRDYVISARDRCDFTVDRIRSVRTKEFKYIRNFMTDRPLMQPQYRDGDEVYKQWHRLYSEGKLDPIQARFVSEERPAEELYHLISDPHETINLVVKSEFKKVLEEMRNTLDNWITETDDKGKYPESDEEFLALLNRWGTRCVNPEFDRAKRMKGLL